MKIDDPSTMPAPFTEAWLAKIDEQLAMLGVRVKRTGTVTPELGVVPTIEVATEPVGDGKRKKTLPLLIAITKGGAA